MPKPFESERGNKKESTIRIENGLIIRFTNAGECLIDRQNRVLSGFYEKIESREGLVIGKLLNKGGEVMLSKGGKVTSRIYDKIERRGKFIIGKSHKVGERLLSEDGKMMSQVYDNIEIRGDVVIGVRGSSESVIDTDDETGDSSSFDALSEKIRDEYEALVHRIRKDYQNTLLNIRKGKSPGKKG